MALTSCDAEFSNDVNGSPEEYHAKIANTHWQLAEVMNQNNEWVSPEFYAGFDIPGEIKYIDGFVMWIVLYNFGCRQRYSPRIIAN